MERRIINVSKRDHIRSEGIRQRSGIKDVIERYMKARKDGEDMWLESTMIDGRLERQIGIHDSLRDQ